MDLIRSLLLHLEAEHELVTGYCFLHAHGPDADLVVDGVLADEIDAHMDMLYDAGFIDPGTNARGSASGGLWFFQKLTWEGRDFLDSVRSHETWKSTKSLADKAGGWTASLLAEVAKQLVKGELRKLGLPIG